MNEETNSDQAKVWGEISNVKTQVAAIEGTLEAVSQKTDDLGIQVASQGRETRAAIAELTRSLTERTDVQPVNWLDVLKAVMNGATLLLTLSIFAVGGIAGLVAWQISDGRTRLEPIQQMVQENAAYRTKRQADLLNAMETFGSLQSQVEHNTTRVHELSEEIDHIGERTSYVEGTMRMIEKQLDAVDNGRSRGWNKIALPHE